MPDFPPLIMGVDVGAGGGLAFLDSRLTVPGFDVPPFVQAYKMPETRADLLELIEPFLAYNVIRRAVVEKVHSSPQMGVASAFTFGMNYERVLMALTCLKIPFVEVTPGTWQKAFMLKKGKGLGLSPTEKKNDHKRVAQELFPSLKVTLAICDALLIADFARRQT